MAARFWVTGGTGNWNSTTNWSATTGGASGASVPSTSDTAAFDASSGSGTATLDISPTIQTLTMTGFTGTLAFGTNTISLNSTGVIFTGATTMAVSGTPLIICTNSSATSRTITPTAVTEANSISFRITAGTGALGLTAGAYRDIDFTDGTNPTGYGGALTNTSITIYGNFKASTSGMTRTAGNGTYTFAATSGTKTITTAAVVFDNPFTFNGVGGTWQLQDALTLGATRNCSLNHGTLNLNNFTLTTGIFSSNNSNTRSLANNSSSIVITGNSVTVVNFGTITNFTADFGPVFNLNYSGSTGTRTITAATPTNILLAPSIQVTAGSDIVTTTGTTTLNDFSFLGFTGTLGNATRNIYGAFSLSSGMATPSSGNLVTTFQGNGSNITTGGKTLDFPITIDAIGGTWSFVDALTLGSTRALTIADGTLKLKSGTTNTVGSFATSGTTQKFLQATTNGSQATLSDASGINSVSYLTIKDSAVTGGATWYALAPSVDAGNNTGWIFFPTPADSNEITMRLRSFTQPRRF